MTTKATLGVFELDLKENRNVEENVFVDSSRGRKLRQIQRPGPSPKEPV